MKSPLLVSLFDEAERRPLTISELTAQVRATLENRFPSVWLEGEISNFKAHTSGHWYFTIKDSLSQLRAVCLRPSNARIRFRPSDGLQVRARGRISVYEPRGEYQINVEALDPVGAGALKVAFEQLKEKLEREGLFDEAVKRPLTILPRRVCLITSISGAAIHDMLHILQRRTRTVDVLIVPVRVQGEGASGEIADAINLANDFARANPSDPIDAIIVGRGGGSIEDLWAFNAEEVARAIRRSKIPVISAVGHETDFTMADFAADVRAPTPSAAAELVSAHEQAVALHVESLIVRLVRAVAETLRDARDEYEQTADAARFAVLLERVRDERRRAREAHHQLELLIARRLTEQRHRLARTQGRLSLTRALRRATHARTRHTLATTKLGAAISAQLQNRNARLQLNLARLDALSPLAVLRRGYALAHDTEGKILRDARQLQPQDSVTIRLNHGTLRCTVDEVK